MLAVGGRAPEFTLPDQDEQSVSLSTLLRHGPLILYFYPADFTPGCTREACSIRDLIVEIEQAGLDVAGVSPQAPASHRAFREKRSEEHMSELQSRVDLVCRLLLEKKKTAERRHTRSTSGTAIRRRRSGTSISCRADFRWATGALSAPTATASRRPGRAAACRPRTR